MLVTDWNIIKNFITNIEDLGAKNENENFRGASYCPTIAQVILNGKIIKTEEDEIILKPGGILWVISKEVFSLPNTMTALIVQKFGYTRRGLLALDTGLIDSGYEGPISSAVMNFSNHPEILNLGDRFFRILFIEHEKTNVRNKLPKYDTIDEYREKRYSEIVAGFGSSFLDSTSYQNEVEQKVSRNLSDNLFDRVYVSFLKKIAPFGVFLAISVFLIAAYMGMGTTLFVKKFYPQLFAQTVNYIIDQRLLELDILESETRVNIPITKQIIDQRLRELNILENQTQFTAPYILDMINKRLEEEDLINQSE